MLINGIEFRQYDEHYFISADGDIYSTYSNRCLKHYIDHDGYHRVDIHGKHMKVHKLVYLTWCGAIPKGKQINHLDDNKENNHYRNLYLGNQTENIADCFSNGHRCGNAFSITVLNKQTGIIEKYPLIKDFLNTTGHSVANGSLARVIHRKWFMEKYEILDLERCRDYRKLGNSQVSRVGRIQPPLEAQGAA